MNFPPVILNAPPFNIISRQSSTNVNLVSQSSPIVYITIYSVLKEGLVSFVFI